MKKRMLTMFLTICFIFTMLPTGALAAADGVVIVTTQADLLAALGQAPVMLPWAVISQVQPN